jgi:hypothetical protein
MNDPELITVFSTNNFAEAEILKNALEDEGIKCVLEGENQGSFAGILEIRGMVLVSDEDRAKEVLTTHSNQLVENTDEIDGSA